MKLRVAIAYHFHDRDWYGGKNYFSSLFRAVRSAVGDDIEFVFITGKRIETTLPQELPWLEVVRTSLLDRMNPSWFLRQLTLRKFDCDPLLANFLRKHRIDVLSHSGNLGPRSTIKTLAWLYDFQFMHLPEYWQKKHIRWAEQRYRAACRQCDGLIVSSRDSLRDLQQFAPWHKGPVHVLPFVSNPVDFGQLPGIDELRATYRLPESFFYLPNQFWTNKNHRLALEALAILKRSGIPATIVCTGKTFDGRRPEYFDELLVYREKLDVTEELRILGSIPYAHTQSLMANARAVINPSRFEGWSTTVEEAKTLHKRLLLSDIAVHREQSPERGRFFSVDAPEELADLMTECLREPTQALNRGEIERDYSVRLQAFGRAYAEMLRQTVHPLRSTES